MPRDQLETDAVSYDFRSNITGFESVLMENSWLDSTTSKLKRSEAQHMQFSNI